MFVKRSHTAHDFELNLTPIIDCFVTLICFMLLSATYINLVGLDAKVPVTVIVPASAEKKDEAKFKLELNVKAKGVELVVSGAGSLSGKKWIPAAGQKASTGSDQDLVKLHQELVKIKRERPKEFSVHFNSEIDMQYEELVRIMDTTRNLSPADGQLAIVDERNGQQVKVDLLFPDFVIANLGTANP
ncbi:MAG: biopolymer transporter ExbD [Bdellovibrionota bacterium]